ncbi:MAG: hypothetical protein ACYS0F_09010 [Planctomycetota bacterium]|jgi:hypothetical protein
MKLVVMLSVVWASVALTMQVLRARAGGRREHSRRAGSPARGLFYNLTVAMTPAHKEAVSRHPVKFALGVLMHVGVAVALLSVGLLVVWSEGGYRLLALARPLMGLALLAGLYLLVQRLLSPTLRAMSAPDDYLAILASCGLLALASLRRIGPDDEILLLLYAFLLLIYVPLGKLRRVVFFCVARADYGRRLGYRGVYPPAATGAE